MNISPVIFIFFFFYLSVESFGKMKAGGYSNMDRNSEGFNDLKTELEESNLSGVLTSDQATVKRLEEAQQQVVAGMNYRILGEIVIDGQSQMCCFQAFRSLKGDFSVSCADCGCNYPTSQCFQ